MNKTLAITAITFFAVVMGMSAIAPAFAGTSNGVDDLTVLVSYL